MALRVTLVVAFAFLSQDFGTVLGPTNGTLSFYESKLIGGDTQTLPACEPFALRGSGMQKHLPCTHCAPLVQR